MQHETTKQAVQLSALRRILRKYLASLPENEYLALEAWLSTFYPFQLEWLLDDADMALCCKGRQIGMSHATAGFGVLHGAFHGELTTIISIGETESLEVLDKVKKHAEVLARLGSKMAEPTKSNATEIEFRSGGRILALPSSGGRGFTGNVFLDEFAYQPHAKKVWDSASAVTSLSGKLRVSSTPNGVGNEFHSLYELASRAGSSWSLHEIPVQVAISQGYPLNLEKCWAIAKGDERLFEQIFNCKFLDGNEQYIPTKLIDACTVDSTDLAIPAPCYAGYDVGLVNDLGALVVLQQTQDCRVWVKPPITCKRTDWEQQQRIILQAFQDWRINRLCIDSTGVGSVPAELLQKLLGKHRVEPFAFTMQSKEVLATGLYQAFADGMIRIPRDEALRRDLCSLRRLITPAGNVRYDAQHTDDGHADRAWALALAIHACSIKAATRVESGPGDYENP